MVKNDRKVVFPLFRRFLFDSPKRRKERYPFFNPLPRFVRREGIIVFIKRSFRDWSSGPVETGYLSDGCNFACLSNKKKE